MAKKHSSTRNARLPEDLTGRRFGRLVVQSRIQTATGNSQRWLCRCDCGNATEVFVSNLKQGFTQSCGCLQREMASARTRTHGMTGTPMYLRWRAMLGRCYNQATAMYHIYGARGIRVCKRWRESFEDFIADMGPMPTLKHTLERIDNNGNYEPDNCRWATKSEQARNRRSNQHVTVMGCDMIAIEAAELFGIPYGTFQSRLKRGWSVDRACTTPVRTFVWRVK